MTDYRIPRKVETMNPEPTLTMNPEPGLQPQDVHGPPPHHILIAGDTGATVVRDGVSGAVVVNVPLVKPLDLTDGRHVVSIGLDAEALMAMGETVTRWEAEHGH